jgi:hypothetical protein
MHFINFMITALLGPVFAGRLMAAPAGGAIDLQDYQLAFAPMLLGVVIAVVLTFVLKETGRAAQDLKTPRP